jgi:O-antigen ligase
MVGVRRNAPPGLFERIDADHSPRVTHPAAFLPAAGYNSPLAAIFLFGILTMWVPARWPLAIFQISLFALASIELFRKRDVPRHPVIFLVAAAALWGVLQIALHRTVYEWHTWEAVLAWTANLCAFWIALRRGRGGFLQTMLIFAFALSIVATLTVLTSPADKVFWIFTADMDPHPTLGPFVYRNQYAAFIEAILPLAIVQAIHDRKRSLLYIVIAAALFASVVAGGSRAGSILCLGEIIVTPLIAYARKMISGRTLARVAGGSLAAVAVLTLTVGWEAIWKRLQEPNPYSVRAELVRSSAEMVRDRPLTGFGLGTWSDAYPTYAHFDDGRFVNQAHNDWIQWAVEGGVPFLVLMLAIVAWIAAPAVRSLWGIGMLAVFIHCLLDYPMQQRPALAAFFFAMLGSIVAAGLAAKNDKRYG